MKHLFTLSLVTLFIITGCQKDYYLEDLQEANNLIAELQTTIDGLSSELQLHLAAKTDYQLTISAQEETIHELTGSVESLQGLVDSTNQELATSVATVIELESTIETLVGQSEDLLGQIDTIIEENQILTTEHEATIAQLTAEVSSLQEEVNERIIEYVEVVNTITEVVTVEVPVVETVTEIVTLTVTQTVIIDNTDYTTIEAQIAEINGHLATIAELNAQIETLTTEQIPVVVASFDFNTNLLPVGWVTTPFTVGSPCDALRGDTPDGSNYFWAANLVSGQRYVQTGELDVSSGGTVSFFIRYGADDPTPECNSPEPGDEVHLQYSTDGGVSWEVMASDWDADTTQTAPWYDWYHNDIDIADGAKTSSTTFRWVQLSSSGDAYDNWGLDDITITTP